FANALGVPGAPADVDSKIASVAPPQLLQYLHECDGTGHSFRVVGRQSAEHANAPNALRLLRPRRERRGQRRERCPTKHPDELAPFQWLLTPVLQPQDITPRRRARPTRLQAFDRYGGP